MIWKKQTGFAHQIDIDRIIKQIAQLRIRRIRSLKGVLDELINWPRLIYDSSLVSFRARIAAKDL